MSDGRCKDYNWRVRQGNADATFEGAQLAVLMDIRDELKRLNLVMYCPNVTTGFRALAGIAKRDEVTFRRRVSSAVRKRMKRANTIKR